MTIDQLTMAHPHTRPISWGGFHAGKEAMSRSRLSAFLLLAVLASAGLVGMISCASAQVVIPTNRNALVQQNQLQQLQNQLQRQQYQQQQQLYRELDRQSVPKPRPDVPVYGQTCRMEAVGNTISRVCR
ncbi:hypothetical protein [Mesorhizobium sp. RIZ17]